MPLWNMSEQFQLKNEAHSAFYKAGESDIHRIPAEYCCCKPKQSQYAQTHLAHCLLKTLNFQVCQRKCRQISLFYSYPLNIPSFQQPLAFCHPVQDFYIYFICREKPKFKAVPFIAGVEGAGREVCLKLFFFGNQALPWAYLL